MATRAEEGRKKRWRLILRAAATLLLVVAVIDLALPELCGENVELISQGFSTFESAATPHDKDGPGPTPIEDCFCCCSHIDCPEPAMSSGAMAIVGDSPAGLPETVTIPAGAYLFRPPRLA